MPKENQKASRTASSKSVPLAAPRSAPQKAPATRNATQPERQFELTPEAEIHFGRDVCGDFAAAESREWLVTNGLGGFASGTMAGNATRRYHGLLVAALQPPVGRTQLVAGVNEAVHYLGRDFVLTTNRWNSGAIDTQAISSL